jgi:hypothetical protein
MEFFPDHSTAFIKNRIDLKSAHELFVHAPGCQENRGNRANRKILNLLFHRLHIHQHALRNTLLS